MTLLNLKSWLTLDETSEQLCSLFGEQVEPKDVLKLGLDGHLKLSIYFATRQSASRCHFFDKDEYFSMGPRDAYRKTFRLNILGSEKILAVPSSDVSLFYKHDELVEAECPVLGICDLPMIGDEKLLVEIRHFKLLGEYKLAESMSGLGSELDVIIKSSDGVYYRLKGSLKSVGEVVPDSGTFEQGLKVHTFAKTTYEQSLSKLVETAFIVVKPSSIAELVSGIANKEGELAIQDVSLSQKKEQTYLAIIGALLNLMKNSDRSNWNQAYINRAIQEKYALNGLKKRKLDEYFSSANNAFNELLKESESESKPED